VKGNSIEEDIKNIEEIIELSKEEIDAKDENITAILDIEDLISLEHILSDYKRVLKENEELKKSKITYEKFRDIQEKNKNIVDNNYIPKQKIKDKIEEINKMIAYEHNDAVIIQLGKQKRVLQKLLESEE
jgi:predicted S18 family serine protease